MTGIERLRHLARSQNMDNAWTAMLSHELCDIAEQIERELNASVADSPYDAILPEEREAIAWVREHGGLDIIKQQRRDSIPRDAYERHRAKLLGHIAECETALSRRREAISRLAKENDELRLERATMRPRLMPEGMEWPMVDGEPVVIGERLVGYGSGDDGYEVVGVRPTCGWVLVKSCDHIHRDEGPVILEWDASKCHRPEPKALDADGVEVEVGDDLYSVEGMLKFHVSAIDKKSGRIATEAMFALDKWADPKMYTHRAPVPAADGRPLREGETVWGTKGGSYHLTSVHDGKVFARHVGGSFGAEVESAGGEGLYRLRADYLTHERPDSWERLEEDASKSYCSYWGCDGIPCYDCPAIVDGKRPDERYDAPNCSEAVKSDIVRRAKALAERDSR